VTRPINQFADALRQFADLSYSGGPVNWELAKNLARHAIVAKAIPACSPTSGRGDRRGPARRFVLDDVLRSRQASGK